VIVSDALAHGDAYMFHPTAFIMATRPPAAPRGANFTSSASAAGLAIRWLMDYDYSATTDRSLVDTFVGYQAVVDPVDGFVRACKIRLDATSVVVSGRATVTAAAGANNTSQLTATTNWGEAVTAGATWTSSAPAKATVSSSGLVTGVAAGTTNITASFDGVTSANYVVTVS
jgi:transglutaminase/protease-like cytokinesis protein 3